MPHLAGHFKIKNRNIKKRIIRKQQRSAKNKQAQKKKSQIQKAAVPTYVMGRNKSTPKENGTGKKVQYASLDKTKGNLEEVNV